MGRKPRLLLLDAGAIFAALRHGAWDALIGAYDIVVPATIVRVEAIFYTTLDGERIEIDLPAEVEAGRITEVEMSAADVSRVKKRFTRDFVNRHAQEGAIRKIQGRGLTSDQE